MSESHNGIKQTTNWISKRVAKAGSDDAKKYGSVKTDEDKKNLSENSPKFWLGKNRSEKTKQKIRETKLKNGLSDKTKKAICKKVVSYKPTNNKILFIFDSTKDAGKHYNISQSTISRRCNDIKKNKGDIFFKFNI